MTTRLTGPVFACVVVCSATCEPSEGPRIRQQDRAATTALPAGQTLALAPRALWWRANREGPYLVSPRFGPTAGRLLASGRVGRGLFLVERDQRPRALDSEYRGPARFGLRGTVCLSEGALGHRVVLALTEGVRRSARPGECEPPPGDGDLGRILYEDGSRRVIHNAMRGTIVIDDTGRGPVVVEERTPWSVRVSQNGRRVAYVVGSLGAPTLYVHDDDHGRRRLGRGAYPVWFPDGRTLIFAVPGPLVRRGGHSTVHASELHAWDAVAGNAWALTNTADLAEMQPAVAPDGGAVAFSDWRYGGLYIVPVTRRQQP